MHGAVKKHGAAVIVALVGALALVLGFPVALRAADVLTLPDAVRRAREVSPQLTAAQAIIDAEAARAAGASAWPNPLGKLSAVRGVTTESDQVISQRLDLFGVRRAHGAVALAARAEAAERLRASRLALDRDVANAYLRTLNAQATVEMLERIVATAGEITHVAERRYEAGSASRLPALRAGIEQGEIEQELLRAREEAERAGVELRVVLGLDALPPLERPTGVPVDQARAAWLDEALSAHPEMRLAQLGVRASEAQVRVARVTRAPFVDLEGYNQQFHGNVGGVRLIAVFPLLDFGSLRALEREARAREAAATAEVEGARRRVTERLDKALVSLARTRERRRAWASNIEQADHLLALTKRGFQAGVVGYLDLLEAQRTQMRVLREALRLDLAVWEAQAELMYAVGREGGMP